MPSSSTASRILPREWEQRKDRIIDLYLNQGLKLLGDDGVIETMKKEGFSATKSQYEFQLRGWDVHKNMTSRKWAEFFSENQESQQTGEPREIRLSGKVISGPRLKTAERRYGPRRSQIRKRAARSDGHASLGSIAFPVLTHNEHTSSGQITSEGANLLPLDSLPEVEARTAEVTHIFNASSDAHLSEDYITSLPPSDDLNFITSMDLDDNLHSRDSCPLNLLSRGFMETADPNPSQLPTLSEYITDVPLDMNTALVPIAHSSSHILPSQVGLTRLYFSRDLWIDHLPSSEIGHIVLHEILENSLANSAYNSGSNIAHYTLVVQLMADITSTQKAQGLGYHRSIASSPHILKYLLEKETFIGEEESQSTILSSDDAFECRIFSRLSMSIANGYVGLEDIPLASILRFLNIRPGMQSSFFQFLKSSSSHAAKSLAENIFQAALEADNVQVARFLLELRFVDANETVCLHRGDRLTPLEKAIRKASLRCVNLLLEIKVEVNKFFSPNDGVIYYLVQNAPRKSTIDEEFLFTVDNLLKAGAIIRESTLKLAIKEFVDPRLARLLADAITSRSPQYFISYPYHLRSFIECFNEADAMDILKLIMRRTQEIGGNRCFDELRMELKKAPLLSLAVDKGYTELKKFLYSTGNQEMNSIDINGTLNTKEVVNRQKVATALESRNANILFFLEENDMTECFRDEEVRANIMELALDTGHIGYAYKILDLKPVLDGRRFPGALSAALANGYDDFAWRLIGAGADVRFKDRHMSSAYDRLYPPLYIAIKQRKWSITRAIIECGIPLRDFTENIKIKNGDVESILELIIGSDDNSILQTFLHLCSHESELEYCPSELELAIERGGLDLFWNLMKHGRRNPHSARGALEVAVEREDVSLMNGIFDLGIELDDELLGLLPETVLEKPSMLELLLSRLHEGYLQQSKVYSNLLFWAISKYPTSARCLDILLASTMVDVNAVDETDGCTPLGHAIVGESDRPGVRRRDIQPVEKLLNAGGDANSITHGDSFKNDQRTAILDAIETSSVEMVELLLQHGARVNEPARFCIRRTPLQRAVEVGSLEIVRLLLSKDADVNAAPAMRGGGTALQLAAVGGNCTIATILIEHGARFDIPPSPYGLGYWPLEGAAANGRLDMIKLLWDANFGAFDDPQCQQAMRLAEYYGHIACRDLINDLISARQAILQA